MKFSEIQIPAKKAGDWSKQFLHLSSVSRIVDESCRIYGPDGKLAAVLMRDAIPEDDIRKAWFHLKNYNPSTGNRGTASGVSGRKRVKGDGTVSRTMILETVNSGIIGYFDRYPRTPYCRKCAWNQDNPAAFADLIPLAQNVSQAFKSAWEEKWSLQNEISVKTHPDFVIPKTVFTTITVNKNYRTAAHKDPRNLEDSIATMLVIHDGPVKGGELILPEFDLAFRFKSGDLVWFDNPNLFHGNAPIIRLGEKAQRCSLVFYFRQGMVNCGSHAEELARAKSGLRTMK